MAAKFAPEIRFEVRPLGHLPFRANLESEFEKLKSRLLAEELDQVEMPEMNAPLRRAANEAAALAWVTCYPLLVFPTLFEEKCDLAKRQAERQARIYEDSRELVCV